MFTNGRQNPGHMYEAAPTAGSGKKEAQHTWFLNRVSVPLPPGWSARYQVAKPLSREASSTAWGL